MRLLKYKVIEANALTVRKSPSKNGAIAFYLKKNDIISIVEGWNKTVDSIKWYKMKKGNDYYYVSSKYLERITPNFRELMANAAKDVYNAVIKYQCKHQSGAKNFEQLKKQKRTTCAVSVSCAAQIAGILKKDKILSHTKAVGSSKAKRKNTEAKAVSGYKNLEKGTYDKYKIMKKFKDAPDKIKKPGAIFVYDSNIAVYKGDGVIYSTNNGGSQKKNGKYVKDTAKSGYCFTSPILFAYVPKA